MTRISIRLSLLAALVPLAVPAESPLNQTRSTLENWVETRQLISRTRSDWQSDKELLEQTVQLYERELKSIEEQLAGLGTNSTQVEKERAQADQALASSREGLERVKKFTTDFEARIRQLVPELPAPLQDILKTPLNRLPADPTGTKLTPAERVQTIVGILNEMDKFNNAVSVFNEKRKNDRGEEVAVETVYVGLGASYFVNDAGNFAGTGAPGTNGWLWTIRSDLAPSIREVVQIYRNERPAKFVSLPATIR